MGNFFGNYLQRQMPNVIIGAMEKAQTQYLLRKLNQVFKDGYRPARGNESYCYRLNNGDYASDMVNCFGHVFNLRNHQFEDYQIVPAIEKWGHRYFTGFFNHGSTNPERAQLMLDFIQETGLKVTECDPAEPVTQFDSWKMALYFGEEDFHCFLEDTPHQWSEKLGFNTRVNHHKFAIPPRLYNIPISCSSGLDYDLYHTYKITNPYASESNPYVKDRELGR